MNSNLEAELNKMTDDVFEQIQKSEEKITETTITITLTEEVKKFIEEKAAEEARKRNTIYIPYPSPYIINPEPIKSPYPYNPYPYNPIRTSPYITTNKPLTTSRIMANYCSEL